MRVQDFCDRIGTKKEDVLIVLGDAGINYYKGERDKEQKKLLADLPITLFCIHGNHEMRPERTGLYQTIQWNEGMVYQEERYPNILFAKDGEVYNLDGMQCIVIGGAYSVDKGYRLLRGWNWWNDEQPSDEIKARVEDKLLALGNQVDIVLTHTCPMKYEPIEVFLPFIDQSEVDKSTEEWLDSIENRLAYRKWYCGHYHTEKKIDKMEFLFESIKAFEG